MRTATYMDLDNMLGYCYCLNYEFAPSLITKLASTNGQLVTKKAYGNIDNALNHLEGYKTKSYILDQLKNADVSYLPSEGKKNSADMEMSLDALQEMDSYDRVYLVSSDSDFNPLFAKLKDAKKDIVLVRMFKPKVDPNLNIRTIYYRSLFLNEMGPDVDHLIVEYRNTLEYLLKMTLPIRSRVSKIFDCAKRIFYRGINLSDLASNIPEKDSFKILKTSLCGGGFRSDPTNRFRLKSMADYAEKAFYRQCSFLLRRIYKSDVDKAVLERTFL